MKNKFFFKYVMFLKNRKLNRNRLNKNKNIKKKYVEKSTCYKIKIRNKKFRKKIYDNILDELFTYRKYLLKTLNISKKLYFKSLIKMYLTERNSKHSIEILKIIHKKYHSNDFESIVLYNTDQEAIEKQNRSLTFLSNINKSHINFHSFLNMNEFYYLENSNRYFYLLYNGVHHCSFLNDLDNESSKLVYDSTKKEISRNCLYIILYHCFLLFKKYSLIYRFCYLKKIYKLKKKLSLFKRSDCFYLLGDVNIININDNLNDLIYNNKMTFKEPFLCKTEMSNYDIWEEVSVAYGTYWFGNLYRLFINSLKSSKKYNLFLWTLFFDLEYLQWCLYEIDYVNWKTFKGKDFFYINFHMNIETEFEEICYLWSIDATEKKLIVQKLQDWVYGNAFKYHFLGGKTTFVNFYV